MGEEESPNMRQEVVSLCDQVYRFGSRYEKGNIKKRQFSVFSFRSFNGKEQISYAELYKINEVISRRFSCILSCGKNQR